MEFCIEVFFGKSRLGYGVSVIKVKVLGGGKNLVLFVSFFDGKWKVRKYDDECFKF